jgi:hypothetical protein
MTSTWVFHGFSHLSSKNWGSLDKLPTFGMIWRGHFELRPYSYPFYPWESNMGLSENKVYSQL